METLRVQTLGNIQDTPDMFTTKLLLPGWEVYNDVVDLVDIPFLAPSQVLTLNGSGAVRQTLSTVAGQKYQLTLSWLPNTFAHSPPERAYLDWNGMNYGRFNYPGGQTPQTTTESFVFLANGNDVLSLISQNSGGVGNGIMFDNISLVQVDSQTALSQVLSPFPTAPLPEPSTYAGIFGAGLMGWALVRRSALKKR